MYPSSARLSQFPQISSSISGTTKTLHLLLVEDNPGDAFLFREAISGATSSLQFELQHVERLGLALERLGSGGIDIVLLDLGLPDGRGVEVVTRIRAAFPTTPIVVLTGMQDESTALAAIQAGAQDYLVKGELSGDLLVRAVRYALERAHTAKALMEKSVELSRANEKLRELNHQKDEFISRVSHELRTPIAAIHQFSSIMADGLAGETSSDQREFLGIVLRNTKDLGSMVVDLIESTRVDSGKLRIQPARLDIPRLVDEVVATEAAIADTKGIRLTSQVPPNLLPVLADPQRVRQVLVNLIDNAIKFTPEHGSITVVARVYKDEPRFMCITVRDTGVGMRPEVHDRVFERLYQDERLDHSRQGLGLGLYICKQLVVGHGGRIWVASEPSRGSEFSFTLPLFSLPDMIAPILTPPGHAVGSGALVIVDLLRTRQFASKRMHDQALRQCRAHLAACGLPGTLLLPESSHVDSPACLFLVAAATCEETAELSARIRDELTGADARLPSGFEPHVSFDMLDWRRGENESVDSILHRLATEIEERTTAHVRRQASKG